MTYKDELTKAMTWLGQQPNTVFLGQQVKYPGNGLHDTLKDVPIEKRVEIGVAEDLQMGLSIGLAMAGKVPISIFPRMDFLMCAMNQLVNHLDKYPDLKVIIRTCVGSKTPLDPGPQHSGDYAKGLREMLTNVRVIDLAEPQVIFKAYQYAYGHKKDRIAEGYGSKWNSTVLVERGDLYGVV